MSAPLIWQGALTDTFVAGGQVAEWATISGAQIADRFVGEAEAPLLAVVDLTPLPRGGAKGFKPADLPVAAPVVNTYAALSDGKLICRLGEDELLLLPDKDGDVLAVPTPLSLPRRDSHFCFGIAGTNAVALLARMCALPSPVENQILQTMAVGVGAVLLRLPSASVPAFYLLGDSGYAVYMWQSLLKLAKPLDGAAAGWRMWKQLTASDNATG